MAVVYLCGWECGDTLLKHTVTGTISVSTSTVRTGQRSLRANNASVSSYAQHFLNAAHATTVMRYYVRWAALPAAAGSDHPILLGIVAAGTQPRLTLTSAGVLKFGFGATQNTHPTTIVTGQWYRMDLRVLNNDGTGTKKFDLQVDGVAGTQRTLSEAGSNITAWRWGGPGMTTTQDSFIDDAIIDNDTAAYPIGQGQVTAVYPTSDGTHSFTAGDFGDNAGVVLSSATTLWQKVDDSPMPLSGATLSAADWLEQIVTRTTGYLEFQFDTSAVKGDSRAVAPIIAIQAETAATATNEVRLNDNGTVESATTIGGSVAVTTIIHGYKIVATRPSGGGVWTKASMSTLRARWGYSSDAAPDVRLEALLLEIEHRPAVTGTGAGTGTASSGSGSAKESFKATGAGTGTASSASGSGKESFKATGGATQTAQSGSGSGTVTFAGFTGTGAGTQVASTGSGSGLLRFLSSGAGTQAVQTASGSAKESFRSTGAGTQTTQSASGAAKLIFKVSGAGTQAAPSASGTGLLRLTASGSGTGAAPSGSGSGLLRFISTGAGTQAPSTASGAATQRFVVSGAGTQVAQSASGTGLVEAVGVAGDGAGTQIGPSGAGTGKLRFISTGAGTQIAQSGVGAATIRFIGSGAGAQTAQSATGSGVYVPPAVVASGAGVQVRQTATGTALLIFTGTGAGTGAAPSSHGTDFVLPEFVIGAVVGDGSLSATLASAEYGGTVIAQNVPIASIASGDYSGTVVEVDDIEGQVA